MLQELDLTLTDSARYAIYFAPPVESALYQFGCAVLGRDAVTGQRVAPLAVNGLSLDRWQQITSSPNIYGFHATLKAPFRLADGSSVDGLVASVERFASARRAFSVSPLRIARLSNFVAFVLQDESPDLMSLASVCVRHFDSFRSPLTEADLARRRIDRLTPRHRALLAQWGYPYVLDEWRFHMTLAAGLGRAEADHVSEALSVIAAPHCITPLAIDAICLFVQPDVDVAFRMVGRFPFR
jgi:putative phosphonate metabolism protein